MVLNDIFDENSLNLLEFEEGILFDKYIYEDWLVYNINLFLKFKWVILLLFFVIKEIVKVI